jgi:glycosyltransferase involved in cell wall biosynthesis
VGIKRIGGQLMGRRNPSDIHVAVVFGNIPLYGQERENINIFVKLKEKGVRCLFLTHREWGHLHIQPELDYHGLPWTTLSFFGPYRRNQSIKRWLIAILELLTESIRFLSILRDKKITHIHVANSSYFLNLFPAIWISRIPVIYRIGDCPEQHRLLYRLAWKWLIIPRVCKFVCVSRFIANKMINLGTNNSKLEIVYNAIPERNTNEIRNINLPEINESLVTFCYVGQISAHKGVDILIEATLSILCQRNDLRLFIAGHMEAGDQFVMELIDEVNRNDQSQKIHFLGYVNNIPELLHRSNVLIFPSVWEEPLGLCHIEAKGVKVPSIVFPSGGLPELIRHGIDGYICSGKTAADLEHAMRYYLDNPGKITEHGKAAFESLEEVVELSKFADKWLQIYREA